MPLVFISKFKVNRDTRHADKSHSPYESLREYARL